MLKRSRGRLSSRAEEGDGADTRARAVSGCGREDDAAAVARVKLGWRGLLGRARRAAGGWRWAERGKRGGELGWGGKGRGELGRRLPGNSSRAENKEGEEVFIFLFIFQTNFPKGIFK